jgi:hypothetical protein
MNKPRNPFTQDGYRPIEQRGYQPTPSGVRPSGVSNPQGGYVPTGSGVPKPPTTGSGVKPPPKPAG